MLEEMLQTVAGGSFMDLEGHTFRAAFVCESILTHSSTPTPTATHLSAAVNTTWSTRERNKGATTHNTVFCCAT